MNKEELLTRLDEIQQQFNVTDMRAVQKEQIEINLISRMELEQKLEELIKYISNDDNYIRSTAELNERRKSSLKDEINHDNLRLSGLETDKLVYNNRIDVIASEIEDTNSLIEDGNHEIEEFEEKVRLVEEEISKEEDSNVNKENEELLEIYNEQINKIKLAVSDLENSIESLEREKEIAENSLNGISIREDEYNKNIEERNNILKDLDSKVSDSSYIDEVARKEDQDRMFELQREIALSISSTPIPYEFSVDLNGIIDGVKNNELTSEQVLDRLDSFKGKISDDYYIADIQNRDETTLEVQEQIGFYEKEIDRLSKKLEYKNKLEEEKNPYLISVFEQEVRDFEKRALEVSISKDNELLDSLNLLKAECEKNISNYQNGIKKCENSIVELGVYFRSLGDLGNDEDTKDFKREERDLKRQISKYEKLIEDEEKKLDEKKTDIKSVNKSIKASERQLAIKNVEPIVNELAIRKDEQTLENYGRMLLDLKAKEEFLSHHLENDIDILMNDLKVKENVNDELNKEEVLDQPVQEDEIKYDYDANVIHLPGEVLGEQPVQKNVGEATKNETIVAPLGEILDSQPENVIEPDKEKSIISATGEVLDENSEMENISEPIENGELDVEPIQEKKKKSKPIPVVLYKKAKKKLIDLKNNKEFWEKYKTGIKCGVLGIAVGATLFFGTKFCGVSNEVVPEETTDIGMEDSVLDEEKVELDIEEDIQDEVEAAPVVSPVIPTYPVVEEPVEEPVVEEPVVEEPVVEEPVVEEPVVEEPVVEEPVVEEPDVEEPVVEEPEEVKDVESDNNYEVEDDQIFYHKGDDGIEVISNDDEITSEEAAEKIEEDIDIPATGDNSEYEDINSVEYNDDGSVNIGVDDSETETTLTEDMQEAAGVGEEELAQQEQDLQEILQEYAALDSANEMGGKSR